MSTVTGPYTIAAGGQVVIPQPQAGGQLSQLILDNLSTYILKVTVGASVYFQAPLIEQAYNIIDTTQPITVSSIVQPGDTSTSGQLAPTWHAIGEEQAGNWPIALSGPAEVAAATAAALLNSGVPNVLREVELANVTLSGTVNLTYDVHEYASVELVLSTTDTAAITATQTDDNGTTTDVEVLAVGGPNITSPAVRARIALSGTKLVISANLTPVTVNMVLIGSNRAAVRRLDNRTNTANGDLWQFSGPMTTGNNYPLTQNDPTVRLHGRTWLTAVVTGTTVTGYFILQSLYLPVTAMIASTADMVAVPGGQQRRVGLTVALPGGDYSFTFTCEGTGGTAEAQLILFDAEP